MRALLSLFGIFGAIALPAAAIAQVPLSPAQERVLKPSQVFKECDVCPEMVVVPAGTLRMGSPKNEKARSDNESPLHKVTIGRRFAVGKFEVTVDQFAAFAKETGHDTG